MTRVAEAFRDRLVKVAGFKTSAGNRCLMRNGRGSSRLLLFFASQVGVTETS